MPEADDYPYPGLGCGLICCHRASHALYEVQGERSTLMACEKIDALGQFEARYNRMRRVLRVITAASGTVIMAGRSTRSLDRTKRTPP